MLKIPEMDNVFISELFEEWRQPRPGRLTRAVNRGLEKLRVRARIHPELATGGMTSIEQRMNMVHLVTEVLIHEVPGDFVELGCHDGKSAALFTKVMQYYDDSRTLHVYDSFAGLPAAHAKDAREDSTEGQMKTTEEALRDNFRRSGLPLPRIHKGWFTETLPGDGLPQAIAFAHLDGDLYESILTSLEHTYPRLSPGAVCLVDDYSDPGLFDAVDQFPGVKLACDEYLADKPERVTLMYGGYNSKLGFGSHGYFRKL